MHKAPVRRCTQLQKSHDGVTHKSRLIPNAKKIEVESATILSSSGLFLMTSQSGLCLACHTNQDKNQANEIFIEWREGQNTKIT